MPSSSPPGFHREIARPQTLRIAGAPRTETSRLFLLLLGAFLVFSDRILAQPVFLNEVVAGNSTGVKDEDGDRPDWIELFNPGTDAINLSGYGLSDDPDQPFKWRFPVKIIPARGFLLVFASGKNRTNSARLHTGFKLSGDGESLQLTRPDGRPSDKFVYPSIPDDYSFGRKPDGSTNLFFFAETTPSAFNLSTTGDTILRPPVFESRGGFHPQPFDLKLRSVDPGAEIRFTLDGSDPDSRSPLFPGSIAVLDRTSDSNRYSMIQGTATNNQHTDGWKSPVGSVRKATVIRARAFRPGAIPSAIETRTFWVGGSARSSLPVISITLPPQELFDFDRGIYMLGGVFENWRKSHPGEALTGHTPANYTQRGPDWERQASLEFFDAPGNLQFSRQISLDIQGQSSRSFRQKSFGIKFTGPPVDYELFPGLLRRSDNLPLRRFEHLRLRNSGNDWAYTLFRDALCHQLVDGLHLDTQAYRPSVVFLDGEYWGILNLREQQDAEYLWSHHGVDPANSVICSASGALEHGPAGANEPFNLLRAFMRTNDLSNPLHYQTVSRSIDIDNFILYHASSIFLGNADWPHNNLRVWRDITGSLQTAPNPGRDGRWRWLLFDCDLAFAHPWSGGVSDETLAAALSPTGRPGLGIDAGWSTVMLRSLLGNPEFKRRFINTSADLLNSWFRENRAATMIDSMAAALLPEMKEHLDRWRTASSTNEWGSHVRVLKQFASQRPIILRQQFVTAFGLRGYTPVTLDVSSARQGRVRINRLTIDSSLPGVAENSYPWRGWYFRGTPVELQAIPNPGWQFDRWEISPATDSTPLDQALLTWNPGEPASFKARFKPQSPRIESVALTRNGALSIGVVGTPGVAHQLQESVDLQFWHPNRSANLILDASGRATLLVNPSAGTQFFRVAAESSAAP